MKKVISLSMIWLLALPFYNWANEFTPCCADHSVMVKVWMDSLKELVTKVKAEDENQFYRKSHKAEGVTYLQFIVQTTGEGIDHYKEMIAKSDRSILNMEVFRQSQRAVEALQERAGNYLSKLKAAATDKESKAILEGIVLELKLEN